MDNDAKAVVRLKLETMVTASDATANP